MPIQSGHRPDASTVSQKTKSKYSLTEKDTFKPFGLPLSSVKNPRQQAKIDKNKIIRPNRGNDGSFTVSPDLKKLMNRELNAILGRAHNPSDLTYTLKSGMKLVANIINNASPPLSEPEIATITTEFFKTAEPLLIKLDENPTAFPNALLSLENKVSQGKHNPGDLFTAQVIYGKLAGNEAKNPRSGKASRSPSTSDNYLQRATKLLNQLTDRAKQSAPPSTSANKGPEIPTRPTIPQAGEAPLTRGPEIPTRPTIPQAGEAPLTRAPEIPAAPWNDHLETESMPGNTPRQIDPGSESMSPRSLEMVLGGYPERTLADVTQTQTDAPVSQADTSIPVTDTNKGTSVDETETKTDTPIAKKQDPRVYLADQAKKDQLLNLMEAYYEKNPGNPILRKGTYTIDGETFVLPWSILKTEEGGHIALLNTDVDLNARTDIGVGGYGRVRLGFDLESGKNVAVKKLYSHGKVIIGKDGYPVDMAGEEGDEMLTSFRDEYELSQKISETVNKGDDVYVSAPLGFQEVNKGSSRTSYVILELAEQGLDDVMASEDVPKKEKFSHLKDYGIALQKMHEAGFVHNDAKLDNALITNGKVTLSDFGYSKTFEQQASELDPDEIASAGSIDSAIKKSDIDHYILAVEDALEYMSDELTPEELKDAEIFKEELALIQTQDDKSIQMILDSPFWNRMINK